MNTFTRFLLAPTALQLALAAGAAEALPPPVDPGQVEIEVEHEGETVAAAVDYQPPTALAHYTVLGEKLGTEITPFRQTTVRRVTIPAVAPVDSEHKLTFVHDADFAANNPEVPWVASGWELGWDAPVNYSEVTLTTRWSGGRVSFELKAKMPSTAVARRVAGAGTAGMFQGSTPSSKPVLIDGSMVTEATSGIGTLHWWPPNQPYRYLPGTAYYFTRRQEDGRTIVYNVAFSRPADQIKEYYPIGELTVTGQFGSIGRAEREADVYESEPVALVELSTATKLRDQLQALEFEPGRFDPIPDSTAAYAFTLERAEVSKLRYKLGLLPGLARTITWAETFTSEGETEPSHFRFLQETVAADATETSARIIDPFEAANPHRFGARKGIYRILPLESALTSDSNGDGRVVPLTGPMTPYRVEFADTQVLGADLRFRPNSNNDIDNQRTDPALTASGPDFANQTVDGVDDLTQFTPVYLEIGHLLRTLSPYNGFRYRLRQADGALNFVFTNLTHARIFDYLQNPDTGFGPWLDQPARSAPTTHITSAGVELFDGDTGSPAFRELVLLNEGGVLLIEARRATAAPLVLEVSRDGQIITTVELALLILNPQLLVDANRDGEIATDGSDLTSPEHPFRFWINDDDDEGPASGDDIPEQSVDKADYGNSTADSVRDLVDFFPVFLDIKQLLSVQPHTEAGVVYKLKHADEALNFIYTDRTKAEAFDHHRAILGTGFGPTFEQPAGLATTERVTAAGVSLSTAFLDGISAAGRGVILVEARGATVEPLRLVVEKNGAEIVEIAASVRIGPVEEMFRHVNLTSVAKNYDGSTPGLPEIPRATNTIEEPANWPDALANGKYFIFVHGYNVDGQKARGWNCEVFKRLHVLGSKARYIGITWHGATGLDYHKAVFQAFQTGDELAAALDFTAGADVTVAAHSLGNMVVSHAIQSGGYSPSRYYMINAAVPIEAYDFDSVDTAQRLAMVEHDWKSRAPRFYAANWHQLFSSTPADHRNELSWKNRFRDVIAKAHNFYSQGEDVVANVPESDTASVVVTVLNQGFNFSRGAWKAQELVKGVGWTSSLASLFMERGQAGWDADLAYLLISPTSITNEQLKTRPYFDEFEEGELIDADAVIASTKASEATVQYDLLARGLPALSFAGAANRILALDRIESVRNFDMEANGRTPNQWPAEGHTSTATQDRWLHSDFKAVALPYVHQMYEAMIARGSLK